MIVHEVPVFEAANDDRGDFADSNGEDDIEECAENIDRYFEGLYLLGGYHIRNYGSVRNIHCLLSHFHYSM